MFQFSLITFVVNIISIPYNSTIIAHERMAAFAYITLIESILKLLIVYLLILSTFDKLIIYGAFNVAGFFSYSYDLWGVLFEKFY